MQEEVFVLGLQKKDQHILEEVMRQYGKLVYYLIHKIVCKENNDAIEEIFNDTFLDLWDNADNIDLSKGTLKNLVCIIARNKALNYLKKSKQHTLVYLEECAEIESANADLESETIDKENVQNILQAIKELNETDSSIFLLRYFYYWPITDIMLKYNMSRQQIDNRLSKGRKKLKKLLILAERRD